MKRILLLGLLLGPGIALAAADDFWRQLTPEERREAGVESLTPEQRAALDRYAARFAAAGAHRAAEAARTETRATVAQELEQQQTARLGLDKPENPAEVVRTRIAGTFSGWSGHTLFQLENGQTWMQSDKAEDYWVPARPGPEVELRHSAIGGWKLTLVENGRWVRVKRVH